MNTLDFMDKANEAVKKLLKVIPDDYTGDEMNAITAYIGAVYLLAQTYGYEITSEAIALIFYSKAKKADETFIEDNEVEVDWDRERCWSFIKDNLNLLVRK